MGTRAGLDRGQRRAHNPHQVGSTPTPATTLVTTIVGQDQDAIFGPYAWWPKEAPEPVLTALGKFVFSVACVLALGALVFLVAG